MVDPAMMPFAGILARVVGAQAAGDVSVPQDRDAMVKAALASLEAVMSDGAQSAGGLPSTGAGTSAIRALIEQVMHQNAGSTAAETDAAAAATAPAPDGIVDASAQALGAAAMVTPPASPVTVESGARVKHTPVGTEVTDDDRATARSEKGSEGATANTASATVAVDPSAVIRETGALDPAFRAKLDRVIERMQREFGHKVTIVETVRSQARQDALYEQGRTAPGQVVTWTRTSRHADGLAADVMIDGGYDNTLAFERLQRIANEEGLHTLGSRDAGHLELRSPQPGGFTTKMSSVIAERPTIHAPAPVAQAASAQLSQQALNRIARIAHVAEVAVTAGVARVASVARVGLPGAAVGSSQAPVTGQLPKAATRDQSATNATSTASELPSVAVNASNASGKASSQDRQSDSGARSARTVADAANQSEGTAVPFLATARAVGGVAAADAIARPDQAGRVEHIDVLHDQAAAQPVSSMVLNVDDGNGGTDRIRVDVRGASVASTIDVRDQRAATEMSARTDELARALESHGLESDAVRVRTVTQSANTDAVRATLGNEPGTARGLAAAMAPDASTPSRRERDEARDPRAGWTQQEQDTNRQRSRREREEQQP